MRIPGVLLFVTCVLLVAGSGVSAKEYPFETDVQKVMNIIINSLYKVKGMHSIWFSSLAWQNNLYKLESRVASGPAMSNCIH
jgi:hypothetical protein